MKLRKTKRVTTSQTLQRRYQTQVGRFRRTPTISGVEKFRRRNSSAEEREAGSIVNRISSSQFLFHRTRRKPLRLCFETVDSGGLIGAIKLRPCAWPPRRKSRPRGGMWPATFPRRARKSRFPRDFLPSIRSDPIDGRVNSGRVTESSIDSIALHRSN